VIRSFETGLVHIFAHPTTRLIGEREPIQLDWARIAPVIGKMKMAVEINASPHRLDVNGDLAKYLKEQRAIFSLGTDAHQLGGLREMEYGVFTARRGWLEARDVINTWQFGKIKKWLSAPRGK
jgi:DNA polymerase (family 10)